MYLRYLTSAELLSVFTNILKICYFTDSSTNLHPVALTYLLCTHLISLVFGYYM